MGSVCVRLHNFYERSQTLVITSFYGKHPRSPSISTTLHRCCSLFTSAHEWIWILETTFCFGEWSDTKIQHSFIRKRVQHCRASYIVHILIVCTIIPYHAYNTSACTDPNSNTRHLTNPGITVYHNIGTDTTTKQRWNIVGLRIWKGGWRKLLFEKTPNSM